MTPDDNVSLRLSMVTAVRSASDGRPCYHFAAGSFHLTAADVEALYADSISGDGGSNTPPPESHGERRR
jgi:hypothetical protein